MNYEVLAKMAEECGFDAWVCLDVSSIHLKQEVRDMCANNTCGQYGKRWSCPPGCGSLEACAHRLKEHTCGILVQTIGRIEDSFDFEAMMEIEATQGKRFQKMYALLQEMECGVLAIGTGCCTACTQCTYPDAPCRFPAKKVSSMEAYGMLVLEVCKENGLQYYYGPEKIAYTGCFLIK